MAYERKNLELEAGQWAAIGRICGYGNVSRTVRGLIRDFIKSKEAPAPAILPEKLPEPKKQTKVFDAEEVKAIIEKMKEEKNNMEEQNKLCPHCGNLANKPFWPCALHPTQDEEDEDEQSEEDEDEQSEEDED